MVSEAADSVDSVPEGACGGGVGTASQPDGEGAAEARVGRGQQDGVEPDATGQEAPDPVAVLAGSVGELVEQVRAHHARAHARERVIDRLHAEVERLRVGEQGLLLRPIVTDLQRLHADLLHQARTLSPQLDRQQAASLLESFALSVELALERCGSVPIRPSVGAEFSAREHRAVKLVEAASPEEDGTIAAVVADGYLDTSIDRVTVPARVHVRCWRPLEQSPPAPPVETVDPNCSEQGEQQESNADV